MAGRSLSRRDGHSSGTRIAARLEQPTRTTGPGKGPSPLARTASSLFGFAPGGACHAVPVAGSAVRSYRTFSPLPASRGTQAVRSLWRYPWGRPRRTLSGTVFPWSPDFPPPREPAFQRERPSGRLAGGLVRAPGARVKHRRRGIMERAPASRLAWSSSTGAERTFVREHRKRRRARQTAVGVAFSCGP